MQWVRIFRLIVRQVVYGGLNGTEGTKNMKLQLDQLGRIAENYPKTFWRVSCRKNDHRIADFSTQIEAEKFAITHALHSRYDYDYKVAKINLSGR